MVYTQNKQKSTVAVWMFLFFAIAFTVFCLMTSEFFLHIIQKSSTSASNEISKTKIVIDAGHGGEDGGAVGINGTFEKTLNLQMSESLAILFRLAGIDVTTTRDTDIMLYDRNVDYHGRKKVLDLAKRLEIGNDKQPDLFVSIHMNSFPQPQYSGLAVYYSKNDKTSVNAADLIQSNIKHTLQPDNKREINAAGSNIYLLDRLTCPAILIECGFISNENECELLCTEDYRQRLSLIIYSSIITFTEQ